MTRERFSHYNLVGHREETRKLMFRALALRPTLETSVSNLFTVANSPKTKLSCNPPTDAAPQFLLETYPLDSLINLGTG